MRIFSDGMKQDAEWFKEYCKDFPTQGGVTVIATFAVFMLSVAVTGRFVLGKVFPEGYGEYLLWLGVLSGVVSAAMIGKRMTDFRYKSAKSPSDTEKRDAASGSPEATRDNAG